MLNDRKGSAKETENVVVTDLEKKFNTFVENYKSQFEEVIGDKVVGRKRLECVYRRRTLFDGVDPHFYHNIGEKNQVIPESPINSKNSLPIVNEVLEELVPIELEEDKAWKSLKEIEKDIRIDHHINGDLIKIFMSKTMKAMEYHKIKIGMAPYQIVAHSRSIKTVKNIIGDIENLLANIAKLSNEQKIFISFLSKCKLPSVEYDVDAKNYRYVSRSLGGQAETIAVDIHEVDREDVSKCSIKNYTPLFENKEYVASKVNKEGGKWVSRLSDSVIDRLNFLLITLHEYLYDVKGDDNKIPDPGGQVKYDVLDVSAYIFIIYYEMVRSCRNCKEPLSVYTKNLESTLVNILLSYGVKHNYRHGEFAERIEKFIIGKIKLYFKSKNDVEDLDKVAEKIVDRIKGRKITTLS